MRIITIDTEESADVQKMDDERTKGQGTNLKGHVLLGPEKGDSLAFQRPEILDCPDKKDS